SRSTGGASPQSGRANPTSRRSRAEGERLDRNVGRRAPTQAALVKDQALSAPGWQGGRSRQIRCDRASAVRRSGQRQVSPEWTVLGRQAGRAAAGLDLGRQTSEALGP